jgi:phosphohistidine phosphatase
MPPSQPDESQPHDSPWRRLILLRHAKAVAPNGLPDEDRPLAGRGVADAAAAGRALAAIAVPDLVLCSPAVRTRQTWRSASETLDLALSQAAGSSGLVCEITFPPVLYGASVPELIAVVRAAPAHARTIVVVGHEPTMSSTAVALAGPGSDPRALAALREKYPTAGLAVLTLERDWAELAPGDGALERFDVPRS